MVGGIYKVWVIKLFLENDGYLNPPEVRAWVKHVFKGEKCMDHMHKVEKCPDKIYSFEKLLFAIFPKGIVSLLLHK
jgi:hypothetical protein